MHTKKSASVVAVGPDLSDTSRLHVVRALFGVSALIGSLVATVHGQTTTILSVNSSGSPGNAGSTALAQGMSSDGRYVAFNSLATDLVPGDTNLVEDVFVRDMLTGITIRVSVDSNGVQGIQGSFGGSISADGRYVAFASDAPNLVPGDMNGTTDVFVHDLQTGTTERVSVGTGGVEGDSDSFQPAISADGRYVAFISDAGDLVPSDTNLLADVFVHDRQTGITTRVSVDSSGAQGNSSSAGGVSISADGRYVAFASFATNLVPFATQPGVSNVYVHDMYTGTTSIVSVGSDNSPLSGLSPSMSADGRFVAFAVSHIYVRDRQAGTTTMVDLNSSGAGGGTSSSPSISADGRYVAFTSLAPNLVPWDTNATWDVFIHDIQSRITTRVSVDSSGAQANGLSVGAASLSSDGRYVAFSSMASNLVPGDTSGNEDVFLRDRGQNVPVPFCFGDGSVAFCPCANFGAYLHGCENSGATGGAALLASGDSSLSADTFVLTSSAELPSALTVFLQGNAVIAPITFGDGLRCAGGTLLRLYVKHASGGVVSAPGVGDAAISVASATLGDAIPTGAARFYQVYYRDASLAFCPSPGSTFNASSAVAGYWGP